MSVSNIDCPTVELGVSKENTRCGYISLKLELVLLRCTFLNNY